LRAATRGDAEGRERLEEIQVAIESAWASCAQHNAAGPTGHEAERHEAERREVECYEVVEMSTEARDRNAESPRGQPGECYDEMDEKTGEKISEKNGKKVCEKTGRADGQGVHGGEHHGGAFETKANLRRHLAGDA